MKLRPYQLKVCSDVWDRLQRYGICYLAGEVRTGKTLVALHIARHFDKVLFITKKAAMQSIEADVKKSGLGLDIQVINYEALHKVTFKPDIVILDEAHCLGMFPIPAEKSKRLRTALLSCKVLLMSGTPSPESYSQLFHQFWVTGRGPWTRYKNFYAWAKDYVDVKQIYVGSGRQINSYSLARARTKQEFDAFKVSMTQEEAGFDGKIIEKVCHIDMPDHLRDLIRSLKKDRVVEALDLIADSGTRLMSYIHQICSGTVIDRAGERLQISQHKINYIRQNYRGQKIAIFYCFIAEGEMLIRNFKCTQDPQEFKLSQDSNLIYTRQIVSGREGVDLAVADFIIFFNISYSATSYFQGRARSQSLQGGNKQVHWLFTKGGIEEKIYNTITQTKKAYTLNHFKHDYQISKIPGAIRLD